MGLRESGSQALLLRARDVALAPSLNEAFFQSAGHTAYDAILREDSSALSMLFGGLELKLANPMTDRKLRLRVQGNRVIVAGGIATMRMLASGAENWPDRETNRASLTAAVDTLLAGGQQGTMTTIARVMTDVIQSFDLEYARFGYQQLDRLRAEEAPEDLRLLATGMLDVLSPALSDLPTI